MEQGKIISLPMEESIPTIKRILDNEIANREVTDLFLALCKDGYDKKYHSWDNYNENFSTVTIKASSWIDQITPIINGMINEIKRLEKENQELGVAITELGLKNINTESL